MYPRQIKVNGQTWKVRRKRGLHSGDETYWGYADYPTKTMTIDSAAKEETLLDTRIHEFVHAFFDSSKQPLFSEETVTRFSTDLGMYLWRCGYRCPEDEEWGED